MAWNRGPHQRPNASDGPRTSVFADLGHESPAYVAKTSRSPATPRIAITRFML